MSGRQVIPGPLGAVCTAAEVQPSRDGDAVPYAMATSNINFLFGSHFERSRPTTRGTAVYLLAYANSGAPLNNQPARGYQRGINISWGMVYLHVYMVNF
jgi:hypothetical protein